MKSIRLSNLIELVTFCNDLDTIQRVYPDRVTVKHPKFGEVIVSHFKNDMNDYRDETHKGKQGRGYIEWRNGDFETPTNVTASELMWLNTWVFEKVTEPSEVPFGGVVASQKYISSLFENSNLYGLPYPNFGR